ncbi:hemerythrin domain-containing protein [Thermomonas fusca]|uniref:hemerythrin domain-containing protein n=1 Tax=Thermomonas fusca TaxID=215690 RepID=UPI0004155CD4|nr:hemerythrin domain-containing protein [Thermomonas fusca]
MNTSSIRSDHEALYASMDELRRLLATGVAESADALFVELRKLSATIKLHLAIEDRMLYPALANASDAQVAVIGKRFQHEMGGLAAAYEDFAARWDTTIRIGAEPERFRDEAACLLDALHARIQHEDRELLPLAESL